MFYNFIKYVSVKRSSFTCHATYADLANRGLLCTHNAIHSQCAVIIMSFMNGIWQFSRCLSIFWSVSIQKNLLIIFSVDDDEKEIKGV